MYPSIFHSEVNVNTLFYEHMSKKLFHAIIFLLSLYSPGYFSCLVLFHFKSIVFSLICFSLLLLSPVFLYKLRRKSHITNTSNLHTNGIVHKIENNNAMEKTFLAPLHSIRNAWPGRPLQIQQSKARARAREEKVREPERKNEKERERVEPAQLGLCTKTIGLSL